MYERLLHAPLTFAPPAALVAAQGASDDPARRRRLVGESGARLGEIIGEPPRKAVEGVAPREAGEIFDAAARELLSALLRRDAVTRRGARGGGEVKASAWFAAVDWTRLEARQVAAC